MNNRYNELTVEQKEVFDVMINAVASHKNTFGGEIARKILVHLRELESELWVNRCDGCDRDIADGDICGREGHDLGELHDAYEYGDIRCCECLAVLTGAKCLPRRCCENCGEMGWGIEDVWICEECEVSA